MKPHFECIMLVDDNPDDLFFSKRVIRKHHFANEIISNESAEEALHYLKTIKKTGLTLPELIFLDINMPGMNGWEFLEELNRVKDTLQRPDIIIMLSSSEEEEGKMNAESLNVKGFLTKPLNPEHLLDLIQGNTKIV